jgi:hypothetical protein
MLRDPKRIRVSVKYEVKIPEKHKSKDQLLGGSHSKADSAELCLRGVPLKDIGARLYFEPRILKAKPEWLVAREIAGGEVEVLALVLIPKVDALVELVIEQILQHCGVQGLGQHYISYSWAYDGASASDILNS